MNSPNTTTTVERQAARHPGTGSDAAFGLWAPAVTPLDQDLAPDAARFVGHLRWLLDSGCHGVALFGTTGEATSFSVEERQSLLETALAAGIAPAQLMVGTGCCALSDTVRLTREAVRLGCSKVLMLPPFYYKGVSDEGLYASYSAVIDRVGEASLRVYLYHFPRLSAVPIAHAVIERLCAAYPGIIAGLKDSSGDAESTRAFLAAFPGLRIFPGTETLMLPALEQGGAGCITASANVNAGMIRQLYDAWQEGDTAAAALQDRITAVRKVLQAAPMIPTLKHVLAALQDDAGWRRVRPPLTRLGEAEGAELLADLDGLGFTLGG